jgi:hypothetical protein
MTDQDLQRFLSESIAPPPLGDDEALESLLDAQQPDPSYGQGMLARARHKQAPGLLKQLHLIAAIVVLIAIPIAIFSIARLAPDRPGRLGGVAGGPRPDDGLIEFKPEFPAPAFFGTPLDIKLPNLEPSQEIRISFVAPKGVHLISHNAKVSSSEAIPLHGSLAMVTDGQKIGDDSHFVELPPGHQWVQIDLGESKQIFAITLWHYHKVMRAYRDVVIEVADDPGFSSGTSIVYNNDHDNSLGLGTGSNLAYIETNHGRIIDVPGISARYVRLHSNGNTSDELNHYTEVEIYGL